MTSDIEGQIEFEHYHRYCIARDYCAGLDVADIASGEGYGAAMLASVACSVVGVEIDSSSISHAQQAYGLKNCRFEQGDALALPLADASVDVVVSFETLEHLTDQALFLLEVRRVLRPGGLFIVSTPNRSVYSALGSDPNPYHVFELTEEELRSLLQANFAYSSVAMQRPILGSILVAGVQDSWRTYERRGEEFIEATSGLARPQYLIALASDAEVPGFRSSAYVDRRRVHDVMEQAKSHASIRDAFANMEAAQAELEGLRRQVTLHEEQEKALVVSRDEARAEVARLEHVEHDLAAALNTAEAQHTSLQREVADSLVGSQRFLIDIEVYKRQNQDLVADRDAARIEVARLTVEAASLRERVAHEQYMRDRDRERFLDASRSDDRQQALIEHIVTQQAGLYEAAFSRMGAQKNSIEHEPVPRSAGDVARIRRWIGHARGRRQAVRSLMLSPLFDAAWYATQVSGVETNRRALVRHYVSIGEATGLTPHRLFDVRHYRNVYLAGAPQTVNALSHYLTIGVAAGHRPHPLFDPDTYRTSSKGAVGLEEPLSHYLDKGSCQGWRPHPLFDPEHYRARNADVAEAGIDPFLHFVCDGAAERRSPHPLFDVAFYLDENPDVAEAGANALQHYLLYGWREGRKPHPLFDPSFYLESNPEVAATGSEPLTDFLRVGAPLGRNPHPLFDTRHYLSLVPEAGAEGDNPLVHYLREGGRRDVPPHPLFHAAGYRLDWRDMSAAHDNALLHYVTTGYRRGARPHPLFDPVFYAQSNPEAASSGLPPLEHYARYGYAMGAACSRLVDGGKPLGGERLALPPADGATVTIIIPVYRSYADTYRCLYSIALGADPATPARVVLADDYPAEPLTPFFGSVPNLTIIQHSENLGFLRSCNRAAKMTEGEMIVFLNNDTEVRLHWLTHLVAVANRDPLVAMVGCKLLNADGTVQEAGGVMFKDGWGHPYGRDDDKEGPAYNFVREVDCVIGACFLVKRAAFEEVGGLDEQYAPAFFEEFDLAFSFADRGYRVMYQPLAEVYHIGSASYGAEMRNHQSMVNHDHFEKKWAARLAEQHKGIDQLFLARDRRFSSGVVLVIDDSIPEYDKHAGALTLFQYLGLLQRLDFKVVYLPHDLRLRLPYALTLQQMGVEVLYGPIDVRAWLQENGSFIDYAWLARPDVAKDLVAQVRTFTKAKLLYYTHDLHFLRERRRFELDKSPWAKQESERLLPIERAIFNAVDVVLTPSPDEVPVIAELAPSVDVRVLSPYIFDQPLGEYTSGVDVGRRRDIIFVGGYAHTPNVDAALLLARQIMPLVWRAVPDAKLLLVGSNPPPEVRRLASLRIDVVGFVPDLAPWYGRARMSVSPLRWGAGVKGKIVESLAAGVPVITTTIGNEGIMLKDGVEALIGDTARDMADHVIALFQDDDRLRAIAAAGSRVISERFSEEAARERLLDAFGLRICSLCGERVSTDDITEAEDDWSCPACQASPLDRGLADVLLRPYRALGCSSVRDALPYLEEATVVECGPRGPLYDCLSALTHYVQVSSDSEPSWAALAGDGAASSVDLVIAHGAAMSGSDAQALFRALKPGGRCVASPDEGASAPVEPGAVPASSRGGNAASALSRLGFEVRVARREAGSGGSRTHWLLDCRKPALEGQLDATAHRATGGKGRP